MKHYIPTTRGLRCIDDGEQQCWVVWHSPDGGSYNEFTGSESECQEYIKQQCNPNEYSISYSEFD